MPRPDRPVAVWLFVCSALALGMIVLGGVTRLTGSGLSIVEWEPISGVLPPLGEAQWEAEFAAYRESPEGRIKNAGMSLAEFRRIYAFEYAHRLLGRAIGIAVAVPLAWFAARRRISRRLALRVLGLVALGGLQGGMGWLMVQSGLVDVPHVSPYRLVAHLGLGLLIASGLFWLALEALRPREAPGPGPLSLASGAIAALAGLTALSGGFVAGTRAGVAYNTFPLIDGGWIPDGMWAASPGWRNLFENILTVQFVHRSLATTAFFAVGALWIAARRPRLPRELRVATDLLAVAVTAQLALGISTLLLRVPVALAAAHQGGAALLLFASLWTLHRARSGVRAEHLRALRQTAPEGHGRLTCS